MTDRFQPQGPDETNQAGGPLGKRLLWFVGLAVASLTVVAAAAYVLRGLLFIG